MAVISYAGSHCFRYDISFFTSHSDFIEVREGEDLYAFKCSWKKLACLDAFLDKRRVMVFDLFNKNSKNVKPKQDIDGGFYILARMQDIGDIWGPIYTALSTTGLVQYYGVSKGVICRVKASSKFAIPGAVQCHYFSRISFFARKTSKLLSSDENLLLAEDDMLLIGGGGLRENQYCKYRLSDFVEDCASDMTTLGPCESFWKMDSRSATAGFSKYFIFTVSGSQKLVPQTTLKEHILDKWTTNPSRANPGILNQYLGVEISHCTGNARRISLRRLMTLPPIWSMLERQQPGWTETLWGEKFSAALHGDDIEAIFIVWRDFVPYRTKMAELVCCMLETLNTTGRRPHNKFEAALLHQNDESAFSVNTKINDWSAVLEDTNLACAYAIVNEQCLNCHFPNHSASSCHIPEAFTVLETKIAAAKPVDEEDSFLYIMKPGNQRLKRVDGGPLGFSVLELDTILNWSTRKRRELIELCNGAHYTISNEIYFKASRRSFQGKRKPRPSATLTQQSAAQGTHKFNNLKSQSIRDQAKMTVDKEDQGDISRAYGESRSRKSHIRGLYEPSTRTTKVQTGSSSETPCQERVAEPQSPSVTPQRGHKDVKEWKYHISDSSRQHDRNRLHGRSRQHDGSRHHDKSRYRDRSRHRDRRSTSSPQASHAKLQSGADDGLIQSDISGQDLHALESSPSGGICDDLANYLLNESEDENAWHDVETDEQANNDFRGI